MSNQKVLDTIDEAQRRLLIGLGVDEDKLKLTDQEKQALATAKNDAERYIRIIAWFLIGFMVLSFLASFFALMLSIVLELTGPGYMIWVMILAYVPHCIFIGFTGGIIIVSEKSYEKVSMKVVFITWGVAVGTFILYVFPLVKITITAWRGAQANWVATLITASIGVFADSSILYSRKWEIIWVGILLWVVVVGHVVQMVLLAILSGASEGLARIIWKSRGVKAMQLAQDTLVANGGEQSKSLSKLPNSVMAHIGTLFNKTCPTRRQYMHAHIGTVLKDYPQLLAQSQLGTQFTGVQVGDPVALGQNQPTWH